MSVKLPPKNARKELKERGHHVRTWSKRIGEDHWSGYTINTERLVTISVVTGKAVVEILVRDTQFEVLT